MRDIYEYRDNFADYADVKSHLLWGNEEAVKCPEVSIIMPCFSHPDYLRESLSSALQQDFKGRYEIIVCDNNELNDTPTENQNVVEGFNDSRVLYYRNEKNIGMSGNWNRLIELAHATFVVYLHDDDKLLPTALSTLMEVQKAYDADGVNAAFNKIDAQGKVLSESKYVPKTKLGILKSHKIIKSSVVDLFLGRNGGFGCGCLFRKKCLLEIGGFSPEFYPSADYALNSVMATKYNVYFSKTPTFCYRIAENESLSVYDKFAELDKHFRRCMRTYIHLPNFVLDRMILAMYRTSKISFKVIWGKADKSLLDNQRKDDLLILNIAHKFRLLMSDYRLF